MEKNFWKKLEKPIFVLAPMADVTDCAFRSIIAKYGKPDVMWTEFVSTDGLMHKQARERLLTDLRYTEAERPIVAQIFGATPVNFKKTAELVRELGFDGIDINMGCPERKIVKQGSCSALIQTPELAQEIVRATKEGAESAGRRIPVSVKTRIGFNKNEIETWIPALLETDPALLTIHGRTQKEMSKVPADWEAIRRAREIRDELGSESLIFGNGDVKTLEEARKKVEETGVDGVMMGKGIFGDPWLFANSACVRDNCGIEHTPGADKCFPNFEDITLEERFRVMLEHTRLFEKWLGKEKNFALMKKHYKAYVEGFPGAKELRMELMEAKDSNEIERIINRFLNSPEFQEIKNS